MSALRGGDSLAAVEPSSPHGLQGLPTAGLLHQRHFPANQSAASKAVPAVVIGTRHSPHLRRHPANPTRRQGERGSSCFPTCQSAAGSPLSEGGELRGIGRWGKRGGISLSQWDAGPVAVATGLPCRATGKASPTKMAPGQGGRELGRRLQVDGGTVGTGCQDVGDILLQESGPVDGPVRQMLSLRSPPGNSLRETSPVFALQDGVPRTPGRPLTWSPPAPMPAASSPGSCCCRCWPGCSLTWAQHG